MDIGSTDEESASMRERGFVWVEILKVKHLINSRCFGGLRLKRGHSNYSPAEKKWSGCSLPRVCRGQPEVWPFSLIGLAASLLLYRQAWISIGGAKLGNRRTRG